MSLPRLAGGQHCREKCAGPEACRRPVGEQQDLRTKGLFRITRLAMYAFFVKTGVHASAQRCGSLVATQHRVVASLDCGLAWRSASWPASWYSLMATERRGAIRNSPTIQYPYTLLSIDLETNQASQEPPEVVKDAPPDACSKHPLRQAYPATRPKLAASSIHLPSRCRQLPRYLRIAKSEGVDLFETVFSRDLPGQSLWCISAPKTQGPNRLGRRTTYKYNFKVPPTSTILKYHLQVPSMTRLHHH